jgi:hypothetical protein
LEDIEPSIDPIIVLEDLRDWTTAAGREGAEEGCQADEIAKETCPHSGIRYSWRHYGR